MAGGVEVSSDLMMEQQLSSLTSPFLLHISSNFYLHSYDLIQEK